MKTKHLSLSLSPPSYNNINPTTRSLVLVRPRTTNISRRVTSRVNTQRWEIRGFRKARSSRFLENGRYTPSIQVEIEEISSPLAFASIALETCANFNVHPPKRSTGKGGIRESSFELLKSFSLCVNTIFFIEYNIPRLDSINYPRIFHAPFLHSPSSRRHRRSWRPNRGKEKRHLFFAHARNEGSLGRWRHLIKFGFRASTEERGYDENRRKKIANEEEGEEERRANEN